eukprot:648504-Pyramimonas_sp.AAC.2
MTDQSSAPPPAEAALRSHQQTTAPHHADGITTPLRNPTPRRVARRPRASGATTARTKRDRGCVLVFTHGSVRSFAHSRVRF